MSYTSPLHSNTSFDEEPFIEESFRDSEYKDTESMKQNLREDYGIENITDSKSSLFNFLFSGKKEIKKLCGLFGTVNKTFQRNPTITKDDLNKTFQYYYGVNLEDNGTGYGLFNLVESIREANNDAKMLNIKQYIKTLGPNYYINNNTRHERKLLEEKDYEGYGEPIGELFKMLIKNIEDKDTFDFKGSWRLLKRNKTAKSSGDADVKNEDVFGILFVYDKNEASVQGRGIVFHIYRNTFTNLGDVKMKKVQSYFMVQNNTLTIYKKGLQPQIVNAIQNLTGIELKNIKEEINLPNNSSNVNNKSNISTEYEPVHGRILEPRKAAAEPIFTGKIVDKEIVPVNPIAEGMILNDNNSGEGAGNYLSGRYIPSPPIYPFPESNNENTYNTTTNPSQFNDEYYSEEEIDNSSPETVATGFSEEETEEQRYNREANSEVPAVTISDDFLDTLNSEMKYFKFRRQLNGNKILLERDTSVPDPINLGDPTVTKFLRNNQKVYKVPFTTSTDPVSLSSSRSVPSQNTGVDDEEEAPSVERPRMNPALMAGIQNREGQRTNTHRTTVPASTPPPAANTGLGFSPEMLQNMRAGLKKTDANTKKKNTRSAIEEAMDKRRQQIEGAAPAPNDANAAVEENEWTYGGRGGKRKSRRRSSKKRRKSKKVKGKKAKPKTKGKKIPFKKLLKKTRSKKH